MPGSDVTSICIRIREERNECLTNLAMEKKPLFSCLMIVRLIRFTMFIWINIDLELLESNIIKRYF